MAKALKTEKLSNAVGAKDISTPGLFAELAKAGLHGVELSVNAEGTVTFGTDITEEQAAAVRAVFASHNPQISRLLEHAKNRRWEKEVGGIVVNGSLIATDRESQAMLTGAAAMAQIDTSFTAMWKSADGTFTELGAGQIIALARAVGKHVQACFAMEAAVNEAVKAPSPTVTSEAQIDTMFGG